MLKIAVFICGVALALFNTAVLPCIASEPVADTIGEVVNAREQAAGYVLDIKARYKNQDLEYIEARRRYVKARAAYTAWVLAVKDAIRQGKAKRLDTDGSYKAIAAHASQAAQQFADYADKVTGESKGIELLLAALVELGLKIWDAFQDIVAKERVQHAEAFEKDVEWPIWERITAEEPTIPSQPKGRLRIE